MKSVYSVLAYYNHRYGVEDVGCSWRYTSALNFYRAVSGRETLAEFTATPANAVDREIYVLPADSDQGFIDKQKLKVVYRGELSGVVVAIRPELEGTARGGSTGIRTVP